MHHCGTAHTALPPPPTPLHSLPPPLSLFFCEGSCAPDGGDLLDHVGGRVQVDEALVDAHLKTVPRVGTLATGRLASRDVQYLGGHADGALHLEALLLGAPDQVAAHCSKLSNRRSQRRQRGLPGQATSASPSHSNRKLPVAPPRGTALSRCGSRSSTPDKIARPSENLQLPYNWEIRPPQTVKAS